MLSFRLLSFDQGLTFSEVFGKANLYPTSLIAIAQKKRSLTILLTQTEYARKISIVCILQIFAEV